MDFRVQQTPSFGLTHFPKNNDALTTTHIECDNLLPPSSQNDRDCPHDRKHHKQTSDGLPFILAGEVQNADGKDGSPMCSLPLQSPPASQVSGSNQKE